jgi:hypothetical protein
LVQFYKPWDLRPEEEDQIKRQIEDAEKAMDDAEKVMDTEVDEHEANNRNDKQESKAKEVQHPPSSASQAGGAEAELQPEERKDTTGDNEKAEADLVGANTTNDEQIVTEKNAPDLDNSNREDKPDGQAEAREEDSRKHGEKPHHDDHGGEELVEGQEDDVIY